MAHKRNGSAAKRARQERAVETKRRVEQREVERAQNKVHQAYADGKLLPEEMLLVNIFGSWRACDECGAQVLDGLDCQTPHCKSLREEGSEFYKEVTDDYIEHYNGARLIAGVDY